MNKTVLRYNPDIAPSPEQRSMRPQEEIDKILKEYGIHHGRQFLTYAEACREISNQFSRLGVTFNRKQGVK